MHTYSDSCDWTMPCDSTKGLFCSFSIATGTNCPTTLGPYTCDCPITKYWTGSTCADRIAYGQACSDDCQCIQNLGMTCEVVSNTKKCTCFSSTSYWNGAVCSKF